jgi:ATP-binding cassette subfamily B protein
MAVPATLRVLRQEPPEAVSALLAAQLIVPADLLICTDTDINRAGEYEPQWLAISADRLLVCRVGPDPAILIDLELSHATDFRCESAVGSGLLQARVDGVYLDLLRYSNSRSDRFAKIARKLERRLKGEALAVEPEEEIDTRRCRGCGLMLDFAGEICPRCVNKGAVLARMWKLMLPYKWTAATMMGLLVGGICLDLVGPRLTQYLIDHVLGAATNSPASARLLMLAHIVLILALVQILRMVVNIINGRLSTKVGTAITFDMRGRLVSHLQQLSVAYYDRQQVGSLVGRVAYDTEALQGFVAQLTGGFLFQIVMVVLVGVMMFSINVKLALFTLVPAPLVIAGSIVFWRYIYPRYYRFWDASSKQAGMLNGMLSGVRVVKAFGQESRENERFHKASDYLQVSRRTVDLSVNTFNPIMGLVFQFGGWIVWYVGGRDVLGGHMSLGALMAFFGYLWMFYSPLGALTQFTNWLTSFVTQAHRLFEILDTPIQIADAKQPISKTLDGAITFEKVSFGYTRHTRVLKDIDLQIKPGEMIGVVGRSGSGKTTIVNLICRFYDVNEGRVLMDGTDIREFATENLRGQIGVVLQEPFLFRGSIWQNIVYGKPDATPEKVIEASKAGNCHDFILRNLHGYDTWVGERGAGLSGGERQRVSIARVLLTDPRILILDEATSSVDAESEAAIQSAMAELVKGRTTIAIAHRLSTLRSANRILVVDGGKIVQSGSHDELLTQGGLYAKLVKMQGQAAPTLDTLHAESKGESLESTAGPLPDIRSFHPRWLTPQVCQLQQGDHFALSATITGERDYRGVYALRCMPIQYPGEFISLRYLSHEKREVEVGLIRRLEDWPAEAQALIEESLRQRYFVHTVRSIRSIDLFQGYLTFDVDTDLGDRTFIMRWQGDKAQDYGTAGKMLLDTEENRYLVADVDALAENERRLFLRYIYW